ncbi:MAG: chaperone modulator CbpM [Neisseria sp.]|nr:chaperone modulator CbpM [Neisseria sp.]
MTQSPDITLTFEEIVAASRCRREWLLELIEEDIISIGGTPEQSTYSGFHLARVRRAQRLSRDFDAGIPALGLIMRLLDEVEELRKAQRPLSLLDENRHKG